MSLFSWGHQIHLAFVYHPVIPVWTLWIVLTGDWDLVDVPVDSELIVGLARDEVAEADGGERDEDKVEWSAEGPARLHRPEDHSRHQHEQADEDHKHDGQVDGPHAQLGRLARQTWPVKGPGGVPQGS